MEKADLVAERLRVVLRHILRRSEAIRDFDAPTRGETAVLGWLADKGPMSPSALSAAQQVRPQTIGQRLETMVRRGWIKRTPHATDRRQILVSLSPSGREALAKGRRLRQAWLAGLLGKLPASERRTLSAALTILEQMLEPEIKS
jgi:DNA-binding MarR family transcriptional regulator